MSPMSVDQALQLGARHQQAGQFALAEQLYKQVLAEIPQHPDALYRYGMLSLRIGQTGQAVELLGKAARLCPHSPEVHCNYSKALLDVGEFEKAITEANLAIEIRPTYPIAFCNLGNALFELQQFEKAKLAFSQAIKLDPNFAEAHFNLGRAFRALRQNAQSIAAYRQAIHVRPHYGRAYYNLGNVLRDSGELSQAATAFELAIQHLPPASMGYNNLGMTLKDLGFLDRAIDCFDKGTTIAPHDIYCYSNRILSTYYHPKYSGDEILKLQQDFWRRVPPRLTPAFSNDRSPDRRLRIGYVSGDFRDHAVGRNILPLIREHHRGQFEIFCYSNLDATDEFTEKFKSLADHWQSVHRLSDAHFSQMIRHDRIDILVDLALHTGNNRLLTFAEKPAPIQVTFAGYPAGTGLRAIDYRLTDQYLDPINSENDSHYVEKSVRLPHCFWCYDPASMEASINPAALSVNELPAVENGFITFGCLNNFCKSNESTWQLWASILASVPRSQLLIMVPEVSAQHRVVQFFSDLGIESARLRFVGFQTRENYLRTYQQIDIGLDTFPYNGHTTSLDSLWMGVPVITRIGATSVSRAGLSQLSNIGLEQLAANNEEQFVKLAVQWAGDIPRLQELRKTLRTRMLNSPLCNAQQFTTDIESAYLRMWRNFIQPESRV